MVYIFIIEQCAVSGRAPQPRSRPERSPAYTHAPTCRHRPLNRAMHDHLHVATEHNTSNENVEATATHHTGRADIDTERGTRACGAVRANADCPRRRSQPSPPLLPAPPDPARHTPRRAGASPHRHTHGPSRVEKKQSRHQARLIHTHTATVHTAYSNFSRRIDAHRLHRRSRPSHPLPAPARSTRHL